MCFWEYDLTMVIMGDGWTQGFQKVLFPTTWMEVSSGERLDESVSPLMAVKQVKSLQKIVLWNLSKGLERGLFLC